MASLTKKAIKTSFVKLLNKRPFDKITVKDVVEECGVNRNTFYYYYQDIYELLRDVFEGETMAISESHMNYDSWEEGIIEAAHFAMNNKRMIYHVYNSISREELERYLNSTMEYIMLSFVKKQAEGFDVCEIDIELIAMFYKNALVGTLMDWLSSGMKREPEQIIRRLGQIFEGNILIDLKRASNLEPIE